MPKRKGPKRKLPKRHNERNEDILDIHTDRKRENQQRQPNDSLSTQRMGEAESLPDALSSPRPAVLDYFFDYEGDSSTNSTGDGTWSSVLDASEGMTPFLESTRPTPDLLSPNQELSLKLPLGVVGSTGTTLNRVSEMVTTADIEQPLLQLPRSTFVPYLQLFFGRLYAIFPVLDRRTFLDDFLIPDAPEKPLPMNEYALVNALSAAVIVQLSSSVSCGGSMQSSASRYSRNMGLGPDPAKPIPSADFFTSQCLKARQQSNFVETADQNTIITSFFLFAYFGNLNQSRSAWYYLREAINFALSLRLGESASYAGLDGDIAQRRQRLYWLLFITER